MLPQFDPRQIDPKAQLLDLDRVDAEESLYNFYRSAWKYIDPHPWKDAWAIDAICEHLQAVVEGEIKRLIINCPPRIGKSSLSSVAFPAWTWAQPEDTHTAGPSVAFLFASYADKLSLRDSVKCRRLIESPWYSERWGNRFQLVGDNNTKSRFSNSRGGERLITSIGAGVTGEGGNCFVAGTQVSVPGGRKNIEDMRVGDSVLVFDVQRGKVVTSRVLATSRRKSNDLCTLYEISGHRFVCTADHPIYSPGRGFIKAGEMGKGDRLLVASRRPTPARDVVAFNLRELWEKIKETSISTAEGTKTKQQRCLLRQCVQERASFLQKLSSRLQGMREGTAPSESEILLQSLHAGYRQLVRKIATHLRNLSQRVSAEWPRKAVLFAQMCGRCALIAHEGFPEFEIASGRSGEVLESVSINENCCPRTGWGAVRSMQRSEQDCEKVFQSAHVAADTPYQRQQSRQSSRELDNALREMSSATPFWENSYVESILRHSGREIEVYDIQVEGESNFFAESILVHNCIVIDDPNAANEVASEATIENTIQWWQTTLPTRPNDQELSAIIVIQQRLAENDLTGHILETEAEGWCHLCLPGRFEPERSFVSMIGWEDPRKEPGELLWPERFSEPTLQRLEKTMGPFIFAGQIQQRPEPLGGGIVKTDWWNLWPGDSYPPMDFILGCLDTAYTEDTANDPSGMVVWGVFSTDMSKDPRGEANRVISRSGKTVREINRVQHEVTAPRVMLCNAWDDRLELHELVERVAKTCKAFKVDLLLIEGKASGHSVAQEIRRLYAGSNFGVQLFDPKNQDKFARLYSVQHLFAEGIIYAPDRPWADKVIAQVGSFGGKPGPKHDEFVDLTSMGLRYLRDNGLIARVSERMAEMEEQKQYRSREQPLYPV